MLRVPLTCVNFTLDFENCGWTEYLVLQSFKDNQSKEFDFRGRAWNGYAVRGTPKSDLAEPLLGFAFQGANLTLPKKPLFCR